MTDSNSVGTCTDTWCDTISASHHFVNNVNLFANSVSNSIAVNIQNIVPPAMLMITDVQGRVVYMNNETVNGSFSISINSHVSGIYYYKLSDANSNNYVGKVIVLHN